MSKGLHQHLGMEIISDEARSTCIRLIVSECHLTPFGTLSGGVMLALEETLAGILSCERLDGQAPVGISITANHLSTARAGDVVIARGEALHIGATTHVWQVKVCKESGKLVSVATVTNLIRK